MVSIYPSADPFSRLADEHAGVMQPPNALPGFWIFVRPPPHLSIPNP